ncbi:hypothetical protein FB480_101858 [Agrobacterium vitis]|nr:hypothetical protein FB480_101858 [Agrobacterium vitis]
MSLRNLPTMIARCFSAVGMREIVMFSGLALMGYGLSLVYLPAAFIAPGCILVFVAIFGVK